MVLLPTRSFSCAKKSCVLGWGRSTRLCLEAARCAHCPPSSPACSGVTGKAVLMRTVSLSYCVFGEKDKSTDYVCAILVYHIEDDAEQNL